MTSHPDKKLPLFKKVKDWADQYGRPDVPDQRGVWDFMECETRESWQSLQAELIAIADGRYLEETLDQLLGLRRKAKHGSYDDWAKLMLQWMATYKA